ncbi:MotA/TolQ/ExbB proton channel family protein [Mucisphaera sp.]|uniref:MotA/TolQ/ExbB proton channel family protein n=1 Tax=Mucisphaera sp. TaxID=2913024 RepID=UPI003D09DD4D
MMVLIERGGPVMWPLLGLSVLALAVVLERLWYLTRVAGPGSGRLFERYLLCLGEGQAIEVYGTTVYARLLWRLGDRRSHAAVRAAVQREVVGLGRFLPVLSLVITVAPMLGILGTVLGIIESFEVLSAGARSLEPREVGGGIAQALVTTAVGLGIAVVAVVAYQLLGGWVKRVEGRLGLLADALIESS